MRPVNLLPKGDRAQAPAAARGSSYVVVGVLAALLLAVFAYVLTSNQVNSRAAGIAEAQAEATRAETRAAAFGSFLQFAQVKAARMASVKALADTRFDWERLMRELALVLPSGSSLTAVTASSGEAPSATAPPTTPAPGITAPTAPGTSATPGVPTLALTGCATSQRRVAVILVRLRQLHRAVDVSLVDSGQSETDSAPTAGAAGCFGSDYTFNASVTFDPAPAAEPQDEGSAVPSSLGGGA